MTSIPVTVTFPSGYTQVNSSISATARMLSGTGRASGGLRKTIGEKALNGLASGRRAKDNVVRGHKLVG